MSNIQEIYKKQFSSISSITGLPFKKHGSRMIAACYIDGSPHPQKDKTWAVLKEKGVYVAEQGGENLSLPEWVERYGGSLDNLTDRVEAEKPKPKELYVDKLHWASTVPVNYYGENLFEFLSKKFGFLAVEKAFHKYNVGIGRDGELIFWYMQRDVKVCHDQRILYDSNGKRKQGFRRFLLEDGYVHRTVFGGHLLRGHKGDVCVVESEKTALIMSIVDNREDRVWVATGGSEKMGCVQNGWKLYPDFDSAGKFWECFGCNRRERDGCIIWRDEKQIRHKDWGCGYAYSGVEYWFESGSVSDGDDCGDWVLKNFKNK